jgi:hypothetical protein
MTKISSFLKDNSGGFSSTRLAFLLWAVGTLGMWLYICLTNGELAAIDNSIIAVLAVLMGGKTVQRFGEKLPKKP